FLLEREISFCADRATLKVKHCDVPLELNLIKPPPRFLRTPDCEPAIQFTPLHMLPSASKTMLPLEYDPPPPNQTERVKSGGEYIKYGTNGALRGLPSFGSGYA